MGRLSHKVHDMVGGHRAAFLMSGGIMYLAIGLSYATHSNLSREAAFMWTPLLTPQQLGVGWMVVGGYSLVAPWLGRRYHWRLMDLGFIGLIVVSLSCMVVFAGAWLTAVHPTGWSGGAVYALMALWILIVSSWPDPHKRGRGGHES